MQNGNNLNANNIKKIKEEIRQFNLAKVEYRIYKWQIIVFWYFKVHSKYW